MQTDEDVLRGLMVDGLSGDAAVHASLLRLLVPLLRGFCRRRVQRDRAGGYRRSAREPSVEARADDPCNTHRRIEHSL